MFQKSLEKCATMYCKYVFVLSHIFFLAGNELSPKMKDFIAYQMREEDWKDIFRKELPGELEGRISVDNQDLYERSYAVIRKLTERRHDMDWEDMKKILNLVNKSIVDNFEKKFRVKIEGKETIFFSLKKVFS